MQPLDYGHHGADSDDDPQMARLDPRASRLKYRLERLMLTPLFRFTLRIVLPLGLCVGAGAAWFAVDENRDAFNLMLADVRAAVEERPEFQVNLMAIDGARAPVAAEIRAELTIDFPISSFDLDLDAMQRRVNALDPVRSAELRIREGGVLQVDVTERRPALLWRTSEGLELLDRNGVFAGPADARAAHVGLPVIAGDLLSSAEMAALKLHRQSLRNDGQQISDEVTAQARDAREKMRQAADEALRLHGLTGPIRARLRGYERMGARRWDVVLDRGQRIMLPETGAERALEWAIAMATTPMVDLLSRDLVAVDLRLPQRPTMRMTDQATQEMWRIKAIEAGRKDLE